MKFTKAQNKAIESAKHEIDRARAFDAFEEWLVETNSWYKRQGVQYARDHASDKYIAFYKECWEKHKNGIVLSCAGKNTIEALVRLGVFKVVEYGDFRNQGVLDWVQLNNY